MPPDFTKIVKDAVIQHNFMQKRLEDQRFISRGGCILYAVDSDVFMLYSGGQVETARSLGYGSIFSDDPTDAACAVPERFEVERLALNVSRALYLKFVQSSPADQDEIRQIFKDLLVKALNLYEATRKQIECISSSDLFILDILKRTCYRVALKSVLLNIHIHDPIDLRTLAGDSEIKKILEYVVEGSDCSSEATQITSMLDDGLRLCAEVLLTLGNSSEPDSPELKEKMKAVRGYFARDKAIKFSVLPYDKNQYADIYGKFSALAEGLV